MSLFPAIRIEGGLLGPDVLDQLLAADLPGQRPADFGLDGRRNLTDEIAAAFADARALWGVFCHRLERLPESDLATSLTRDAWVIPFLGLLGYELRYNPRAYEVDELSFAVSHRAGEAEDAPPIHIVGARQELGRLAPTGRQRLAPHSLVQEYVNRTEHLWGIVTNGLTIRLLRDCTYIRRQAYVEFDLASILEEQHFQDFAALYRLLHRTRLPHTILDAPTSLIEQYYQHSVEQGGRVRDRLRDGVEECVKRLANGFLRHPANHDLRRRVAVEPTAVDLPVRGTQTGSLTLEELYRQLLRLVYRLLFLLVSEDRGLLSPDPLYREQYGIARLRRLLDIRGAYNEYDDLGHSLRVLWKVVSDDKLAPFLKVAPLNGELFAPIDLDRCVITNRDLLEAFWHLAYYQESPSSLSRRVNYAALDVEELGSVYESLLEYHPHMDTSGQQPQFDLISGSERRSTGSYYTAPELVAELIRSTLVPVIEERLQAARTHVEKERAILSIRVCDPAAGSGHFLLAAARRLGKELARIRTGEDEPAPERVREAIRDVMAHGIYGVDKNPLAVELCRVALWLEAHAEGKPLTFLDHRIRCGDSLVGIGDIEALRAGIPDEAFKPLDGDDRTVAREAKRRNAAARGAPLFHGSFTESVRQLAEPLRRLEELPEDTLEQVREKIDACRRVERGSGFEGLRQTCDAWTAAFFQPYTHGAAGPVTTQALHDTLSCGRISDARLGGAVLQTSIEWRFFHWPLALPEVFAQGGFDVVIGNPPFMGGYRIPVALGPSYRRYLVTVFYPATGLQTDLCAAFYRRAFSLLRPGGRMGMVATNTIGQGDTRESGLAVIVKGGAITFAKRFVKWPGAANVEVNLVGIHKRDHSSPANLDSPVLDGQPVPFISSRLDSELETEPNKLHQNHGKAFLGSRVRGIGFVLELEEAEELLAKDPRNADCLFPYFNGEDLNSRPDQSPSRWVICFFDWPLSRAQKYPDLLKILEERVKPARKHVRQARDRENWWLFQDYRRGEAIAPLRRVLVRSRVSELHALAFVPRGSVHSEQIIVFAFDDDYHFALLQTNLHETWLRKQASSLRTDIRYTPTDCFDTFPFPQTPTVEAKACADRVGGEYHEHRRQVMLARNLGLTKTYNLFHNSDCTDADIQRLRELHAEMDRAILSCYGWQDLDPQHGFYQNERGQTRFTVSPDARRDILKRLLELNLAIGAR